MEKDLKLKGLSPATIQNYLLYGLFIFCLPKAGSENAQSTGQGSALPSPLMRHPMDTYLNFG
jgi:hypothetical protein